MFLTRAEGRRCDRCWKVDPAVPEPEPEPSSVCLCPRCHAVVHEMGRA